MFGIRLSLWNAVPIYTSAFLAGFFSSAFMAHPPTASADMASWTQAIGALIAVGIAIWVPIHQHAQSLKKDCKKELRDIACDLQSLREELSVMSEGMMHSIGKVMDGPLDEGIIPLIWRPTADAYVVYLNMADRLGRIPDQNLRRGIIRTYARLRGVVMSFCQNSELLEKLEMAEEEVNLRPSSYASARYKRCQERLQSVALALVPSYQETMRDVVGLIELIDFTLAKGGGTV